MPEEKLATQFASPERSSGQEINDARRLLSASIFSLPHIADMLDSVLEFVVVLDKNRQIVYFNRSLEKFLKSNNADSPLGKRPGEAFNCLHAGENQAGCGTTEFCRECGAVRAILTSQMGTSDMQECRIPCKDGTEALDLLVATRPVDLQSERFTFCSVFDISDQKRRRALERIFFHDVLNIAGAVLGFAELLLQVGAANSEDTVEQIFNGSRTLIEEIQTQRDLLSAENSELVAIAHEINSGEFLRKMCDIYREHQIARGKRILIAANSADVTFKSDPTLLRRVIANMLKNALEASVPGDSVTVGCAAVENGLEFFVHNPAYMRRDVQLMVFQRSFSTRGANRGLGTYSIKLLTERYLKGEVSFKSSPEEGTTFFARYPLALS